MAMVEAYVGDGPTRARLYQLVDDIDLAMQTRKKALAFYSGRPSGFTSYADQREALIPLVEVSIEAGDLATAGAAIERIFPERYAAEPLAQLARAQAVTGMTDARKTFLLAIERAERHEERQLRAAALWAIARQQVPVDPAGACETAQRAIRAGNEVSDAIDRPRESALALDLADLLSNTHPELAERMRVLAHSRAWDEPHWCMLAAARTQAGDPKSGIALLAAKISPRHRAEAAVVVVDALLREWGFSRRRGGASRMSW